MFKLIKKVFIFALPLIIGGVCLELALRNIPNDYRNKNIYLETKGSEIETLVLGSSHSFLGVNPKYFSKNTFNACHVSQSINYDLAILKKNKDNLPNLKQIVLSVDYLTFSWIIDGSLEGWRSKNYPIYYGVSPVSFSDNFELTSTKFSSSIDQIRRYYQYNNTIVRADEKGWAADAKSGLDNDLEVSGVKNANDHITVSDTSHYSKNHEMFTELLDLCKASGIKVLLYTPPAFSSYRKTIHQNQIDKSILTAEVASKNYSNCEYINLYKDSRFGEKDYFDGNHLNDLGAKKLSLILNDIIEN